MQRTGILVALLGVLFIGLLMIGRGITGMVISGQEVSSDCSSSIECGSGQVCCKFYGKEFGVCHLQSQCLKITEITREEQENYADFLNIINTEGITVEEPAQLYVHTIVRDPEETPHLTLTEGMLGLIIAMLAFIGLYLFLHYDQHLMKTH